MKKLFTSLLLVCFLLSPALAQISTDEQPISFDPVIALALRSQQTDLKTMAEPDMAQIEKEDEQDELNGLPPRFGYPHEASFNLRNSGVWTTLQNGDRIWQLSIRCPGALSINLLYDQFWLPEQAKLFLYTSDRKHTIGAFTSRNNKGTAREIQGFATGLLYGEAITLEYYLPKDVEEDGVISIAHVVHGYRYINLPEDSSRNLGSSGDCQVNVNCPEGGSWQQEKNAVALILVGGTRMCTGSLINTTCNDERPLFLTADHCLVAGDAISNPNLTTWSFYWHYERPGCPNTGAVTILSTTGATVVANNPTSDFALLRLTEDPKERNGVTPYYLGWDRSGNPGTGGVGIHHPSGDAKKIATYTITPPNSDCFDVIFNGAFLPNDNFWKINWISTANGHSVTENVSSGSPLINNNRKVIGQLFGSGLCPNPNCSDPAEDVSNYGKFSVSWTGNGATDNRRRLDHWLHPGGGTAPNTLDGKAATLITGPSLLCSSETYTVTNLPTGATVTSWNATPAGAVNLSGSGASRTVTKVGSFNGQITLTATISTACGSFTPAPVNVWIGTPIITSLTGPQHLPNGGTFMYYANANSLGGTAYSWSTLPVSLPITSFGSSAEITFPLADADYNVVVTATNGCGNKVASLFVATGENEPWLVYPNPADETVVVSIGEAAKSDLSQDVPAASAFTAILYDDAGRPLRQGASREGRVKFDTRGLVDGTYFLHILHAGQVEKRQVIIRH